MSSKSTKNITVDADLVDKINEVADALAKDLGFRPTISQTLRHLIQKASKQEP